MTTPPPPLEWHPAYGRQRGTLLDWLNERGPYADRDSIKLPRPVRASFVEANEVADLTLTHPMWVLTRHKALGLAPYVGSPFHYEWWVARDQLGRSVAGDTRIVRRHLPAE